MNKLAAFHHWDVVALLVAMCVVFGFEMVGVFSTRYVTITYLTRTYVPVWARAMMCGWLCWHFVVEV